MHELAVTENLLALVCQNAEKAHATKVTDIYLKIGQLSSIVDDSIQFYWEMISKNTICQQAQLHFNRIPASFKCQNCGHEFIMAEMLQPCPNCTSSNIRLCAGDEFQVESIEVVND